MKKLVIFALVVMLTAGISFAQMSGGMSATSRNDMGEQKADTKSPCMAMNEGQAMSMMQMCMPMMKQMMGEGMMKQDMMQMMMDMMSMQEKMIKGTNASEKKKMMNDMAQMKAKMNNMMSMNMGMMMGAGDSQDKLKYAEQWLKKAIDLHEVHIKDPKTATEASQMEMMDQMKKAYECVIGKGTEIKNIPTKGSEVKEPQKADPHKH